MAQTFAGSCVASAAALIGRARCSPWMIHARSLSPQHSSSFTKSVQSRIDSRHAPRRLQRGRVAAAIVLLLSHAVPLQGNAFRLLPRAALPWRPVTTEMPEHSRLPTYPKLARARRQAGLIYRDVRLTNWCCQLRSGISDIEVDYVDIEARTRLSVPGHAKDKTYIFGAIWSFAYKLVGSDEEIVVATTRPETMLGDTGVAVHPDDPRYKQFHGKFVQHPFVDRQIPVITDSILVDMSFGTGAVKVTPAHDPNDFLCGRRHGLPEVTVFTDEGAMTASTGQVCTLSVPMCFPSTYDICLHDVDQLHALARGSSSARAGEGHFLLGVGALRLSFARLSHQFAGLMRLDARVEVLKALKECGLSRGEAVNKST